MHYLRCERAFSCGLILSLTGLLTACDFGGGGDSGLDKRSSVRDGRYCELLAVYQETGGFSADVWNTWRLNDCPQEDWVVLDAEAVQQELEALTVAKNGPRFWTLDALAADFETYPELRQFGDIQFGLAAEVSFGGALPVDIRYVERSVQRDTEFRFWAGKPTYELIAPLGKHYIMQSYAQIEDPSLTLSALDALALRLTLPTGWTYRVNEYAEDLLIEDYLGRATVVQDELSNSYQRSETLEERAEGLELVELVNRAEGETWSAFMDAQAAAVLLVEFPWEVKSAERLADKVVYSRSPDAATDGRFTQQELFGHTFSFSGSTLDAPVPDTSGLLKTGSIRKFQELTFPAGTVLPYLTNSIGEQFILVSFDGSFDVTEPTLPPGWSWAELELAGDWRIDMNRDFEVVLAANDTQNYQGPVTLPLEVSPAGNE